MGCIGCSLSPGGTLVRVVALAGGCQSFCLSVQGHRGFQLASCAFGEPAAFDGERRVSLLTGVDSNYTTALSVVPVVALLAEGDTDEAAARFTAACTRW